MSCPRAIWKNKIRSWPPHRPLPAFYGAAHEFGRPKNADFYEALDNERPPEEADAWQSYLTFATRLWIDQIYGPMWQPWRLFRSYEHIKEKHVVLCFKTERAFYGFANLLFHRGDCEILLATNTVPRQLVTSAFWFFLQKDGRQVSCIEGPEKMRVALKDCFKLC